MNFKKAIEILVARQVPYGKPDYRDPTPTSWQAGQQMVSHGKRRICHETGSRWAERANHWQINCDVKTKNSTSYNVINVTYVS